GAVAGLVVAGDDDRGGLVGPVDRHLLGHVVRGGALEPRGAHEDHRLAGQVDVLLVLGGVAGDRPVAELAELDAQLGGGDPVHAVADDGPVPLGRRELASGGGDRVSAAERLLHLLGEAAQLGEQRRVDRAAHLLGDGPGEEEAGGDLGVERLGGGHAHLHVAPVGGVEDAVGLVREVRAPAVDDRHDGGASPAGEFDVAVGVGGGARLADGREEGAGHVGAQPEAGQLGGGQGLDPQAAPRGGGLEGGGEALAGHVGGALADDL